MAKLVMEKKAYDNTYLHRDFHGLLDIGITYLRENYGEQAVRDYLRQFAAAYYAPLKADLKKRGLIALREYFEKIYEIEGGGTEITLNDRELTIRVDACPAVTHLHKLNVPVDPLFFETTRVVNEEICEGTPFASESIEYSSETGASLQRFFRRDI
ncbi:MAG: hypothetical protein P4M02_07510 [Clostridia bacterium]|nr:hypothetical protein [Clostridia bacterium]